MEWPLVVPYGYVGRERGAVYFRSPDETLYALNGVAMNRPHYQDITPLQRINERHWAMLEDNGIDPLTQQVPHMGVGDLIRIGLDQEEK